nr:DUF4112 domain-containing protein [Nitrospira sp. KM1]
MRMLDTTVKIPGTNLYLGLDPLIGLIPGIGDLLANLLGTVILGLAAKLQVPRIVLFRMSLNLLINGVLGAVPFIGDLFSVWFRSHSRNAELLRQALATPARSTGYDWLFVIGVIGGTIFLMACLITGILWIAVKIWSSIVQ